ncbi:hypothetical protein FSP39_024846 [Pinctada imbricata]|uniref:GST N-terminal domain-containing protein n=1 Tax=Pinctada imbricata TaxID=66713 RepID=A0AA89BPA7_PINIB|nr:hypothetical protein FSP39_024846 [Pinctada imbricata]
MAEKMELIWGSGSAPCWRAMIVLEEKGLQGYKSDIISFGKQEHKGEKVLKLNPRGQVPVFKDGDVVINESLAICDYLERKVPDKCPLYPTDLAQAAKVLQRVQEGPEELQKRKDAAANEIKRWEEYLEKVYV